MSRRPRHASDPPAWYPWYWRDHRASATRSRLSPLRGVGVEALRLAAARGILRELMDAHWGEPDCSLEDSDAVLAALADVALETWSAVRELVLPALPLLKSGRRRNPRTFREWKDSNRIRSQNRQAAKQRWNKQKGGEKVASERTAPADADGVPTQHSTAQHRNTPAPKGPPPPTAAAERRDRGRPRSAGAAPEPNAGPASTESPAEAARAWIESHGGKHIIALAAVTWIEQNGAAGEEEPQVLERWQAQDATIPAVVRYQIWPAVHALRHEREGRTCAGAMCRGAAVGQATPTSG